MFNEQLSINKEDLISEFLNFQIFTSPNSQILITVILLMLLNWGVEAVKWRYLISKREKVSFIKSYTGVLTGITISTCMPNRVGEYLGRVFVLDKADRGEGVLITVIGSISQLLVTIITGLIAGSYLIRYSGTFSNQTAGLEYVIFPGIFLFNTGLIILCLYLYFNISSLMSFFNRLNQTRMFRKLRFHKLAKYIRVFTLYSNKELLRVLLLSFARYIVFGLQFYLLLRLFGIEIPLLKAIVFICSVFFITTIIPTVGIADLGVRGTTALAIFQLIIDKGQITENLKIELLITTTALWFINLIIPALAGSILIFKLKFFRKNL